MRLAIAPVWFEQAHVEDRVDLHRFGEVELTRGHRGDFALGVPRSDHLNDRVWSDVAGQELRLTRRFELDAPGGEEHLLAQDEFYIPPGLIIVPLLPVLRRFDALNAVISPLERVLTGWTPATSC